MPDEQLKQGAEQPAGLAEAGLPAPVIERFRYLDRLKVGLIAAIIFVHGVIGYSGFENAWPYQAVREVPLSPAADTVLGPLALAGTLFAMGLFFLIAGLLVSGSLSRRGAAKFARGRLLRLGVPLVVWVLVLWPLLLFAMVRLAGRDVSYWWLFLHLTPFLDTGPMWFVELLLIYSLGYALWWARWGSRHSAARIPALTGRTLLVLGAGVAMVSFTVRLVFPYLSFQVAHLNLWQWPQYLALFGLGTVAARAGWLDQVPDGLRRACGIAALLGVTGLAGLVAAYEYLGVQIDHIAGGWSWLAVPLPVVEATLAIGVSVWVLGTAQRYLDRPAGPLLRATARSAYGAFILQGPVLVGLAVALRGLGTGAEVKALAVAVAGVALSFGLSWLLVSRTPLRSIL
jgi:hypothetical protein